MKSVAILSVMAAALAQAPGAGPAELLDAARPLTSREIAAVLQASQRALTDRTFRLSSGPDVGGPEVLMGAAGQPRIIRTLLTTERGIVGGTVAGSSATPAPVARWREEVLTITEHAGSRARHCDGSPEPAELVIDYERRSPTSEWTVTARTRGPADPGGLGVAPVFALLRGAVPLSSGAHGHVANRRARAFVAPWTPRAGASPEPAVLVGDPMPNVIGDSAPWLPAIQTLWIDMASLLPLRWEVTEGDARLHGFEFFYRPIDLRPPSDIVAPDCIPLDQ